MRERHILTRILLVISLLAPAICALAAHAPLQAAEGGDGSADQRKKEVISRLQETEQSLTRTNYDYNHFVAWEKPTPTDDLNSRCKYMLGQSREGSSQRDSIAELQGKLSAVQVSTIGEIRSLGSRLALLTDSLVLLKAQTDTASAEAVLDRVEEQLGRMDDMLHLCQTMISVVRVNCLSEEGRKQYADYYATVYGFYQSLGLRMSDNGSAEVPAYLVAKNSKGVALTYLVTDTATCQVGPATGSEASEWAKAVCSSYKDTVAVSSQVYGFKVNKVGHSAFSDVSTCRVSLPLSVDTIGYRAFYYAHGLDSILIPSGASVIESYAYYGVGDDGKARRQEVTLPATLQNLSVHCFSSGRRLEISGYQVQDGNTVYSTPAGSHAVLETSTGCLRYGGTDTVFPDGVTSIGGGAFAGARLSTLSVPSGVTEIGERAFYECASLTSVTLPASVVRIANEAFRYAPLLQQVTIHAEAPEDIGWTAFGGISSDAVLYVPEKSLSKYQAFEAVNSFSAVKAIDTTDVLEVKGGTAPRLAEGPWYDLHGRQRPNGRGLLIRDGRKYLVK